MQTDHFLNILFKQYWETDIFVNNDIDQFHKYNFQCLISILKVFLENIRENKNSALLISTN